MKRRIVIIGAGPIGIEAALYAAWLGFEVRVFERSEVGGNIRDWGHVRMFSPWKWNTTPLGRSKLGRVAWKEEECPTGREFCDAYLEPLAQLPELSGTIRTGSTVLHIGRVRTLKHEAIGDAARGDSPFRVMVRPGDGAEIVVEAEVVIDASGVYSNPGYVGDGGIPAVGELANRDRIQYRIEDVLGRDRARYEGRTTLVVGSGHSAATTIVDLKTLCKAVPTTRVVWAARPDCPRPYEPIDSDPLAGRAELVRMANEIALGACPNIQYLAGHTVEAIEHEPHRDQFRVTLRNGRAAHQIAVDRIIAQVGYGPDNSIYRQLQVHECYATRGPMTLAAALLGEPSKDCLAQASRGAETLRNPEPNFFILGHKSYGTQPNFLLRAGHEQVRDVFQLIQNDPSLDLYAKAAHESSVPVS